MSVTKVFRVCTPGYVAAVFVKDGIVVQSAPILRRYVGMHWAKVKHQLRRGRRAEDIDIMALSGATDDYDNDDEEFKLP